MSFWQKYSLEQATSGNQGDFVYVRVSSNSGSSWTNLYTATGSSDWVQEKIDLTPWRGREILVQFWLWPDGDATVGNGWFIDEIRLEETTTGPLGGLPFVDDTNDDTITNMYWQSSTFELIERGSFDGSQHWNSRPRTQNHSSSGVYRTFARMTLANEIDLTGTQNPQLVFRHSINRYGATYYVQISQDGGLNWATLFSTTTSTGWTEKKLSLASYINQKIRIRFYVNRSYYTDRWLIDNIQVREDPAATAIVDFATIDFPNVASAAVGNPTGRIQGSVFEPGITEATGQGAGLMAQLGYGPDGVPPRDSSWTWPVTATYLGDSGNRDVYFGILNVGTLGTLDFAFRFSINGGVNWIFADTDGNDIGSGGTNGYSVKKAGKLIVTERPELSVNVSELVLSLPENLTGNRAFGIQNSGVGSLVLTISEADTLPPTPTDVTWLSVASNLIVNANERKSLVVTFDATGMTSASIDTAYVVLDTNDPDEPRIIIRAILRVLDPSVTQLVGLVKDVFGRPVSQLSGTLGSAFVPFASIQAFDSGGNIITETTAGDDGLYAFYGLSTGNYDLRAYADGFFPSLTRDQVVPDAWANITMHGVHKIAPTSQWVDFWSPNSFYAGQPIQIGDVVSVRDPDGVVAGTFTVRADSSYGFMPVYRDDITTPEDEGAEPGDTLSFYVNDFIATVVSGDPVWREDGAIEQVDLSAARRDTMTLRSGFNLISFNVDPPDKSVSAVLSTIDGKFNLVRGFAGSGRTYVPGMDLFNTLTSMDGLHGYWVKMDTTALLTVQGQKIYDDTFLSLASGWNSLSYLPETPDSTESALSSIIGLIGVVSGFDDGAMTFVPGSPFNDLTLMKNNLGYFIRTIAPTALNYRIKGAPSEKFLPDPHIIAYQPEGVNPTVWWADYYGSVTMNGSDLPAGSIIEAYDPDGVKAGVFVVDNDGLFGFMPVYGDDPSTSIDEGAEPGDVISFYFDGRLIAKTEDEKVRWSSGGEINRLDIVFEGAGHALGESRAPRAYDLYQNFPNPFNPETTIEYQVPKAGEVVITVYSVSRQEIKVLVDEQKEAGFYSAVWNGRDSKGRVAASGVYVYKMEAGEFTKVRKMILIK